MIPLLLYTMAQFMDVAPPAEPAFPVPFDFAVLPIAGSTNVPLNAQLLIPVPQAAFGTWVSRDQFTFALVLDDDIEVGNTQEVQLVTHACFDMEVIRLLPTLPLLPQTRYRVIITPDDPNTPAYEATSFVTGDSNDNEPPPSPVAQPGTNGGNACGVDITISHAPQTVVTSIVAGGQWIGLSATTSLLLDGSGSSSFALVAIDVAGNVSPPTVVNIDFPVQDRGRDGCGCHQRGEAAPSWLIAVVMISAVRMRRRP